MKNIVVDFTLKDMTTIKGCIVSKLGEDNGPVPMTEEFEIEEALQKQQYIHFVSPLLSGKIPTHNINSHYIYTNL